MPGKICSLQAPTFCQRCPLVDLRIEKLGNPFEEDSKELSTLDTKQIADISVIETVRSAYKIGKDQFDLFVKERPLERKASVDEVLSCNKLTLFTTKHLSD